MQTSRQKRNMLIIAAIATPMFLFGSISGIAESFKVPPEQMLAQIESKLAAGQITEASALLVKAREKLPDSFQVDYLEGELLFQEGKKTQALAKFKQAAGKPGATSMVYQMQALIHDELDQFAEAQAALEQALLKEPGNAVIHNNLGMLKLHQKDLQGAQNLLGRAIQLQPNFPDAHRNLASLYQQTGSLQGARQHFEIYLKLRPDAPERESIQSWLDMNKKAFETQE